jgi:hypothetical protein
MTRRSLSCFTLLLLASSLWPAVRGQPLPTGAHVVDGQQAIDHGLPCSDSSAECLRRLGDLAVENCLELGVIDRALAYQRRKLWTSWLSADGLNPLAVALRVARNLAGGGDRAAVEARDRAAREAAGRGRGRAEALRRRARGRTRGRRATARFGARAGGGPPVPALTLGRRLQGGRGLDRGDDGALADARGDALAGGRSRNGLGAAVGSVAGAGSIAGTRRGSHGPLAVAWFRRHVPLSDCNVISLATLRRYVL